MAVSYTHLDVYKRQFINSVNGFIYLYSGKKTDYYHGLPMKRTEMFLERVFSGLVYYLMPYIVAEFLMICIGAARGFFSLSIMGMAVKMFFLHIIIYLVIYFSIVLVISVTGNMLMGILCLGGMYSVSYTHLDVYKRQIRYRLQSLFLL